MVLYILIVMYVVFQFITLLGAKRKTKDSELSDRKRLLTGACSLIGWREYISKRRISCTGGKTFGNLFG